jgi:hypothetical protein
MACFLNPRVPKSVKNKRQLYAVVLKSRMFPSSGSKNKPNTACDLLHADFLLGLFFDPEDGGHILLGNVG